MVGWMVALDELRAQVAADYDRLGLPSWPNPHPGMAPAREEEYSRVTDPERYAIVYARARIWADRLHDLAGAKVGPLAPAPLDDEASRGRFDRGVRLTSPRPGTLPLLLLEHDAPLSGQETPGASGQASLAVLRISVAAPEIVVATLPDCGCDACDLGSQDLLDAIDETVGVVVGGPFVVLRNTGWRAYWHPGGGSSGGTSSGPSHDQAMELCRRLAAGQDVRLPSRVEAVVGGSWLT